MLLIELRAQCTFLLVQMSPNISPHHLLFLSQQTALQHTIMQASSNVHDDDHEGMKIFHLLGARRRQTADEQR